MGIKIFHGTTRWKRFRTWQHSLSRHTAVTGIGCWVNEEGLAELYVEYGGSNGDSGKELRDAWEKQLQENLNRR